MRVHNWGIVLVVNLNILGLGQALCLTSISGVRIFGVRGLLWLDIPYSMKVI